MGLPYTRIGGKGSVTPVMVLSAYRSSTKIGRSNVMLDDRGVVQAFNHFAFPSAKEREKDAPKMLGT
jgi:hypothetical protein